MLQPGNHQLASCGHLKFKCPFQPLVHRAVTFACGLAMAQQTCLDTPENGQSLDYELHLDEPQSSKNPGSVIVVAPSDQECEANPPKRQRLEIAKDCSADRIKWVNHPTVGLIPFVLDAHTQKVHAGRSQMRIIRGVERTYVECLSGCHPECSGEECTCLCHLLRAYYNERLSCF